MLVGMQTGTAPLDISMAVSQKIRKQPTSGPSNTTFEYIPKGCSINHNDMFIAALFVIARAWKQHKCPLTKEWIKMNYICTMEYYTAEKNNDILKFADKEMDLENIIFSEVTQTQKENYHMYSYICGF